MMIRRRRSTPAACLSVLACMRLRLLARVRVSAGVARLGKDRELCYGLRQGGVGGGGLDLAGFLAADNISGGTGGTIC
jgi:hypothetical protein